MKHEEAVGILEALMDGANPITGETLSSDHVCQDRDVIRALHTAIIVLNEAIAAHQKDRAMANSRKTDKLNAGRPWTESNSQQLISLYLSNASIEKICHLLQRRPHEVYNQLAYLGLDSAEVDEQQLEESTTGQISSDNGRKPWTLSDHKWLMAAWYKGCTIAEMADYLGRTAYAIRLHLEKCSLYDGGMTAADEPPPWTNADTNELFHMVDAGCTTAEMAERFGRTVQAMEARLFYLGLSKKAPKLF